MDPRLPNVLVIGAMKAGTTSLHRHLDLHPEIGMSERKELHLFTRPDWRQHLDWYTGHFSSAAPVQGESSPNYTKRRLFPGVPARIAAALPEVRLIYILRDPVERMRSAALREVAQAAGYAPARTRTGALLRRLRAATRGAAATPPSKDAPGPATPRA